MARKTVAIKDLIEKVNRMNRMSTCGRQHRDGWNTLLEQVLVEADVYRGFSYLEQGDVPPGSPPGIIRGATPEGNIYPDDSRRAYQLHYSLCR